MLVVLFLKIFPLEECIFNVVALIPSAPSNSPLLALVSTSVALSSAAVAFASAVLAILAAFSAVFSAAAVFSFIY